MPANVAFLDLDLPYTFYPTSYDWYFPYIKYREELKKSSYRKDVYRAIAIVAQTTISHGEELYVNYLEDQRTPITYTPDWLLEPPPASPYLIK